jgi:hypothetical protein
VSLAVARASSRQHVRRDLPRLAPAAAQGPWGQRSSHMARAQAPIQFQWIERRYPPPVLPVRDPVDPVARRSRVCRAKRGRCS